MTATRAKFLAAVGATALAPAIPKCLPKLMPPAARPPAKLAVGSVISLMVPNFGKEDVTVKRIHPDGSLDVEGQMISATLHIMAE